MYGARCAYTRHVALLIVVTCTFCHTYATTTLVKDILPGSEGSVPQDFVGFGDGTQVFFFIARDNTTGSNPDAKALWRTDGTADGTRKVRYTKTNSGDPDDHTWEVNSIAGDEWHTPTLFTASSLDGSVLYIHTVDDETLWYVTSADPEARLLQVFVNGDDEVPLYVPEDYIRQTLPGPQKSLYMLARNSQGSNNRAIYMLEPLSAPNSAQKLDNLGSPSISSRLLHVDVVSGTVYLKHEKNSDIGFELYTYPHNVTGTAPTLVADLVAGDGDAYIQSVQWLDGTLWFMARYTDSNGGYALYRSGGTAESTHRVIVCNGTLPGYGNNKTPYPSNEEVREEGVQTCGESGYVSTYDSSEAGIGHRQLFWARRRMFHAFAGDVYFVKEDRLYRVVGDATSAEAVNVASSLKHYRELTVSADGQFLYAVVSDQNAPGVYAFSDDGGTLAMERLTDFPGNWFNSDGSYFTTIRATVGTGPIIFFSMHANKGEYENVMSGMWRSDGTAEGTYRVCDAVSYETNDAPILFHVPSVEHLFFGGNYLNEIEDDYENQYFVTDEQGTGISALLPRDDWTLEFISQIQKAITVIDTSDTPTYMTCGPDSRYFACIVDLPVEAPQSAVLLWSDTPSSGGASVGEELVTLADSASILDEDATEWTLGDLPDDDDTTTDETSSSPTTTTSIDETSAAAPNANRSSLFYIEAWSVLVFAVVIFF